MKNDKNDILLAIIKNEYEACTEKDLILLNVWYNNLDDEFPFKDFRTININKKKAVIWSAINSKIGEETNVLAFPHKKYIYYNILRIAAILVLLVASYSFFIKINTKTACKITYLSKSNYSYLPVKIILPDNSLVWLQSKSAISYPEHFTKSRNIVLLFGKVFFNVKHDSKKPFVVKTLSGLKTTVLGTAFVLEYEKIKNSLKVSVLRGKVEVSDNLNSYATLGKNQGLKLNLSTKKTMPIVVDSLVMTKWFNSKVVLDNVSLKIVAASIKENYGFEMVYSSKKLLSKPCSITYNSTDNPDSIFSSLDKIYHTTHTYSDDSTVYIKPKINY